MDLSTQVRSQKNSALGFERQWLSAQKVEWLLQAQVQGRGSHYWRPSIYNLPLPGLLWILLSFVVSVLFYFPGTFNLVYKVSESFIISAATQSAVAF